MSERTYTARLRALYDAQFQGEATPQNGAALLDWVWMRLLLGEPVEQGSGWWREQSADAQPTGRPAADLFRWGSLAAAAELLGEDGARARSAAGEFVSEAAALLLHDTSHALVLQYAIGLALLGGDAEATTALRVKRLELPMYEGWEGTSFEILYSSSSHARHDDLATLATATTRVSVEALETRPFDSVAPLVLALASHARAARTSLNQILAGRAGALDQEVFSGDGSPRLVVGNASLRIIPGEDGGLRHRVLVPVKGRGALTAGAHAVAPLTTKLPEKLRKAVARQQRATEADSPSEQPAGVEGVLRLAEGVELAESQRECFARRLSVAVEHTRHLTGSQLSEPNLIVTRGKTD